MDQLRFIVDKVVGKDGGLGEEGAVMTNILLLEVDSLGNVIDGGLNG